MLICLVGYYLHYSCVLFSSCLRWHDVMAFASVVELEGFWILMFTSRVSFVLMGITLRSPRRLQQVYDWLYLWQLIRGEGFVILVINYTQVIYENNYWDIWIGSNLCIMNCYFSSVILVSLKSDIKWSWKGVRHINHWAKLVSPDWYWDFGFESI